MQQKFANSKFLTKVLTFVFVLFLAVSLAEAFPGASPNALARPAARMVQIPPRPHNSYILDENRLMTAQQVKFFNILAEELYRKTGVGMAAALMNDIGVEDARTFAVNTAHSWGVGGKSDEGILIFVAMKQKRRSVEIGYGAEGYLPDVLVERIQQKTLIPAFRKERYGEGVLQLAYSLAQVVAKEKGVTLDIENREIPEEMPMTGSGWGFIIIVIILLLLASRGGGGNGCLWFWLGSMMSSGHHHRGGSGFGGGFGGGSFGGGFGGGGFGGGGSGGSW